MNRCWPLVPTDALAPAAGLSAAPPAVADADALGGAFCTQPVMVIDDAAWDNDPGARVWSRCPDVPVGLGESGA